MYAIVYNKHFAKANIKLTECVITPNKQKTVITIFSTTAELQNIHQLSSIEPASCSIKEKYMNELSSWKMKRKKTYLSFSSTNFG